MHVLQITLSDHLLVGLWLNPALAWSFGLGDACGHATKKASLSAYVDISDVDEDLGKDVGEDVGEDVGAGCR